MANSDEQEYFTEQVWKDVVDAYVAEMMSDDNLCDMFHNWVLSELRLTADEWDVVQELEDESPLYGAYYAKYNGYFQELVGRIAKRFEPNMPPEGR